MKHSQVPHVPVRWPRWIETPDGNRLIVPNKETMSAMMGEEYDDNAELVVKKKPPPTLSEVLAAGYEENAAMQIVANEQAKVEQGVEPYGEKPITEFVYPQRLIVPESAAEVIPEQVHAEPGLLPSDGFTPAAVAAIAEKEAETVLIGQQDSEEFIEGAAAMMDLHGEQDLAAADPAGIFASPEPEEVVAVEKKRRGRPAAAAKE